MINHNSEITKNIKISVIIVTFNSEKYIARCINALDISSRTDIEIIVVDNASTDKTLNILESEFPLVKVYMNSQNLGFAAAANLGTTLSSGINYCFINPDLEISIGACLRLIETLYNYPGAGIIGPKIIGNRRKMNIISSGHFPTLWRIFTHFSGLSRIGVKNHALEGHYFLDKQIGHLRETDWVTGACLIVSRKCWDELGGFSTRWFMYAEDIDLCYKAEHKK